MIIIKLQGGLGNQMFQFAIGSILALKNNSKLKIDFGFYENKNKMLGFTPRQFELSIFDNHYQAAIQNDINYFFKLSKFNILKKQLKLNYPKIFIEPNFGFDNSIFLLKTPIYLDGYFQSYRYFEGFEEVVRKLFSFSKINLGKKNEKLLELIKNKDTVAVHIRRGDYVNDKLTQQIHGTCTKEYYLEAINNFEQKKPFTYVFFSDDIEWVKDNFNEILVNKLFVDQNSEINGWKDMFLMSCCDHNIIANSSFSWWGAWLNSNEKKVVIAPSRWFTDDQSNRQFNELLPKSWIRI